MKTVMSNDQVAHVWAQQSPAYEGVRIRSGSMSAFGSVIFSYSTAIAAFVAAPNGGRVVLVNSNKYSATTSCKHMPAVRNALRGLGLTTFHVPFIGGDSTDGGYGANLEYLVSLYTSYAAKLMKANNPLDTYHRERLQDLADTAREYARVFGLPEPEIDVLADWLKAQERQTRLANDPKRKAKREAAESKRAAKAERDAAERVTRDIERLADWRAGSHLTWNLVDAKGGAYLRIQGDEVQTSRGARVPIEDAKRVIQFVRRMVEQGRGWNPEHLTVGAFTIDVIYSNGDIKAGCHFIQFAEIDTIGKQLGV